MEKFYLSEYLLSEQPLSPAMSFSQLCETVRAYLMEEWEQEGKEDLNSMLQLQKKALIGYENEVAYFKSRIRTYLKENEIRNCPFPEWYQDLCDGVYQELFGMAGISQWFTEEYRESSSAKIIGERIYFLHKGRMELMPQRMDRQRREQLIRSFLLLTPEERLDKDFHEVYLLDGTRITIFGGSMVKEEEDVIIFRRYVVPEYSFEEQAARGTIPSEAIPLFETMVKLGYNVAFTGAVRTAKTSFLCTWQSYEDPRLEGVMVETDPEIPLHRLMPEAPIIQLLADNEALARISKNLLRSDADYFIMAEARDGNALDTAIRIASKGTRRMKITFHGRDPMSFARDVAWEIVRSLGGSMELTAEKVASSFDYVFQFVQLTDKSRKRLKAIYEMRYSREEERILMEPICLYDYGTDSWSWRCCISDEKAEVGMEEDREAFQRFRALLKALEEGGHAA